MQQETQQSITAWAEETFGAVAHHPDLVKRALLELQELEEAVSKQSQIEIAGELADVMILLYRLAELNDIDLKKAIDEKMNVNRHRRWKKNGDGTGRHI
jgi:NTP pyrophosphatase (non-canonical NTP hydrolase)